MMYLIVGRTGSGKDYLANLLTKENMKMVKSYTTRPKRHENEDTHIFITKEEADAITDKVATTEINGYEYFATASQVNESDIYIIDPNGVKELTKNMPDTIFHLVYVSADDMNRRFNAVRRAEDKIKEEMVFDSRDESEDAQFTEFENQLKELDTDNPFPENITKMYMYENDYNEPTANEYVQFLLHEKAVHDRMTNILKDSIDIGLLMKNEDNPDKFLVGNTDGSTKEVNTEHFADVILDRPEQFMQLMKGYIALSDKFKPE